MQYDPHLTKPIPWWVPYIRLWEDLGTPPWELIGKWSPRRFWLECAMIVKSADRQVAARQAKTGKG